jgi:hypothetical protein
MLGLDMPFGEALERFGGVDPRQLQDNIARSKKKKPPGRKKKKPGGKVRTAGNVISMRERHMSLRRRGLA